MTIETFRTMEDACAFCGVIPAPRRGMRIWTYANIVNDPHGRGDGRIKYFPDNTGGIVCNWKTNTQAYFFYNLKDGGLTEQEKKELREKSRRLEKERLEQEAITHGASAFLAREIVKKSAPMEEPHPYLVKKHIVGFEGAPSLIITAPEAKSLIASVKIPFLDDRPQFIDVSKGALLVMPLTGDGAVESVQMINGNGDKLFLKGGRIKGLVWRPEGLPIRSGEIGLIGLAEGVATAVSVSYLVKKREGLYLPCVAGLNAGNLKDAVKTLRECYPNAYIQVFADNDKTGVGKKKALDAVNGVDGANVEVCPAFSKEDRATFKRRTGNPNGTDFNDWMVAKEIDLQGVSA